MAIFGLVNIEYALIILIVKNLIVSRVQLLIGAKNVRSVMEYFKDNAMYQLVILQIVKYALVIQLALNVKIIINYLQI